MVKKKYLFRLFILNLLLSSLLSAKCTGCGCMVDISKFLACEEQENEATFFEEKHLFICEWEDALINKDKFVTLILNYEEMIVVPFDTMSEKDDELKVSILNEENKDSKAPFSTLTRSLVK